MTTSFKKKNYLLDPESAALSVFARHPKDARALPRSSCRLRCVDLRSWGVAAMPRGSSFAA